MMPMTLERSTLPKKERERHGALLNKLLRGELSAVETYEQALEKFESDETIRTLVDIRNEHMAVVKALTDHLMAFGVEPELSSGLWGSFARTVTGAAKILGPQTVIAALHEGEEHGILAYENAINNTELPHDCFMLIHRDLIPLGHKHCAMLEGLIQDYTA